MNLEIVCSRFGFLSQRHDALGKFHKTKTCVRDALMYCDVMSRKEEKMQTNKNTMWPEKIAAIYAQFPWLQKVYPQAKVDRAYVKRVEPSTLDVSTCEEIAGDVYAGLEMYTYEVRQQKKSVYLVDQTGTLITVGEDIGERRILFLYKYKCVRRFTETLRQAIRNLPRTSTATYVVLIQHGNRHSAGDTMLTHLTVFKPAQNGMTLRQWYTDQSALINSVVNKEIEIA